MTATALDRFVTKFRKDPSGCWVWTGAVSAGIGYGRFKVNGFVYLAHRWSYMHYVGPIPDGLVIDHLCRNRACVNPDHLEPVTQAVNSQRRAKAPDVPTCGFCGHELGGAA